VPSFHGGKGCLRAVAAGFSTPRRGRLRQPASPAGAPLPVRGRPTPAVFRTRDCPRAPGCFPPPPDSPGTGPLSRERIACRPAPRRPALAAPPHRCAKWGQSPATGSGREVDMVTTTEDPATLTTRQISELARCHSWQLHALLKLLP